MFSVPETACGLSAASYFDFFNRRDLFCRAYLKIVGGLGGNVQGFHFESKATRFAGLSLAPSLERIRSRISFAITSQSHPQLVDDYARQADILDFVDQVFDRIPIACDDM